MNQIGVMRTIPVILISGLIFGFSARALADRALPPSPPTFISDEVHVISPQTLTQVDELLRRHETQTGDQILIAIFDSLQGEDLVGWTHRVYQSWKIGVRGRDNGALLAIYWKDRLIRLEVGYGLEPVLTDYQSKRMINEVLQPALKANRPNQAVIDAALEMLKVLKSPALEGSALSAKRSSVSKIAQASSRIDWVQLYVILVIVLALWLRSRSQRTHYEKEEDELFESRGKNKFWKWPPGPGGWGGGGDGGGFSGGGGSSGGGGASGRW